MLLDIANENDIDSIEECGKTCLPLFYKKNELLSMLNNEQFKIIKATQGNELLGFLLLSTNSDKNIVHIMSFAIYLQHRNKQIGTKMLDLVKQIFSDKNITLFVQTTNKPAIKFYKKNDFIIMKEKKDYYTNLANNNAYAMIYLI
jgi:ribosomal protein S18 acetylase RimI-like enzyme